MRGGGLHFYVGIWFVKNWQFCNQTPLNLCSVGYPREMEPIVGYVMHDGCVFALHVFFQLGILYSQSNSIL